jgi:hypothetical protein
MSSISEHKRRIQEHLEEMQDAINIGLEKRPATIGFHASACAMEMLEMYLHLSNLISTGKKINHNWFKRPHEKQKIDPLIERKLPVSFPDKDTIYDLIYSIEDARDSLMYGKPAKGETEAVVEAFQKFRVLMEKKMNEKGENFE